MVEETKCIEKDCGKMFVVTASEGKYFTDKDLMVPRRCLDCRRKRREEREEAAKKALEGKEETPKEETEEVVGGPQEHPTEPTETEENKEE